ncbi:MAG: hypothetical protein JNJ71_03455 [Rubrivivax sp.]|nr:hypothetical protein [Rubrivivax sp.]
MLALSFLHVLCLVFWLGTDVGTFYASRFVADPRLAPAERGVALRIMMGCDLAPRLCMPLTLATGFHLALVAGHLPLPAALAWAVWAGCALWLWAAWRLHTAPSPAAVASLARVDFNARILLALGIGGAAVLAWAGLLPAPQRWLAIKLLCFALAIVCGLMIRVRLRPFGAAWARLQQQGAGGEADRAVAAAIAGCVPWVLLIWALLLLALAAGLRWIG